MNFKSFFNRQVNKVKSLFIKKPIKELPKKTVIEVPYVPKDDPEPSRIVPTKAYFDQRQKAKRNRRRKPSKQMRHLYKL